MPRADTWSIADLLDFESLLAADANADEAALRTRDQQIYAHSIAAKSDEKPPANRRFIFHRWLEARREAEGNVQAGRYFRSGWQTLVTVAGLLGLIIGVGLTAGMLHYNGNEPVNVAWFFAATVGVQLLILAVALGWWVLQRATHLLEDFGPLQALLAGLVWSFSAGLRQLPGEQRERFRAVLATIGHRREIYGSLAAWPLLVVTQVFGVCFNVGVLGTLLLHVALSDVAFAWQSTLRTSPDEAYHIASVVATPWAFAPNAHPTLDQVVDSRFVYSAKIQPDKGSAMASWWPFLAYSVAIYGLLVRLLLLIWFATKWRQGLASIAFDHHGCNALFRRLTGPVFHTQAEVAALQVPASAEPTAVHASGNALLLQASDLTADTTLLAGYLHTAYRWETMATHLVQIDHPSGNGEALQAISAAHTLAGVVVALRAQRAPIKAIALFLQNVVSTVNGRAEVLVLLVGRSSGESFAPVPDEQLAHWRNFNAIHQLHLEIARWSPV